MGGKQENKTELGTELCSFDIMFNESEHKESSTCSLLRRKKNYSSYPQYDCSWCRNIPSESLENRKTNHPKRTDKIVFQEGIERLQLN